ncbi:hypothetical protein HUU62_18535 [Rhodoferax sp. 4810]|nr:hypothetical protein [Rhodoferax jenense]
MRTAPGRLARNAPFARNVDALFEDFFLTPMSLDSTATGRFPMEPPEDVSDQAEPIPVDRPALAQTTDGHP